MSENRGEAGEGRNATDTHERRTRGRGAHLPTMRARARACIIIERKTGREKK